MTCLSKEAAHKWCNYVLSSNCRHLHARHCCRYQHVDDMVRLSKAERVHFHPKNLMDKHAKLLTKFYADEIERMTIYGVVSYSNVVAQLTEIGWDTAPVGTSSKEFVQSLLGLVTQTLHYDIGGAPDIMFESLSVIDYIIEDTPSYEDFEVMLIACN